MYGTCFYPKWVKNAKMRQHFLKFWQSIDFPVGSEFKNSSEGPLKYAKMTIMDILPIPCMHVSSHFDLPSPPNSLM